MREFVPALDVDVSRLDDVADREYVATAAESWANAGASAELDPRSRELFDTGRSSEQPLGALFRFNLAVALGRNPSELRRFLIDSPAHYYCL